MARECIGHCPEIQAALAQVQRNALLSGPAGVHPDTLARVTGGQTAVGRLMELCGETYDCPGPGPEVPKEVAVGGLRRLFGRKTMTVTSRPCGRTMGSCHEGGGPNPGSQEV